MIDLINFKITFKILLIYIWHAICNNIIAEIPFNIFISSLPRNKIFKKNKNFTLK